MVLGVPVLHAASYHYFLTSFIINLFTDVLVPMETVRHASRMPNAEIEWCFAALTFFHWFETISEDRESKVAIYLSNDHLPVGKSNGVYNKHRKSPIARNPGNFW